MGKVAFVFFTLLSLTANADNLKTPDSTFFYPEVVVDFPIFTGIGGGFSFNDHIQADFTYGIVPQPFYSFIAQIAARSSGNSSYKDVIEAAFQNNSLLRSALTYNLQSKETGWHFSLVAAQLNSSGSAEIDQIIAASNGGDFTILKALLIASGKSSKVDMTSTLQIVEVLSSYSWFNKTNIIVDLSFGVAKVIDSDVNLKTGLLAFEASPAGKSLLRSSETDIENIINEYGLAPTVGIQLKYIY